MPTWRDLGEVPKDRYLVVDNPNAPSDAVHLWRLALLKHEADPQFELTLLRKQAAPQEGHWPADEELPSLESGKVEWENEIAYVVVFRAVVSAQSLLRLKSTIDTKLRSIWPQEVGKWMERYGFDPDSIPPHENPLTGKR